MTSRRSVCAMIAALCAASVLAGCANSGSAPSSARSATPSGLAGHSQAAVPAPVPPGAVAEPPPEVPPGPPSKSYAYRGGRDPLTGQATIVEGAAEPLTVDANGNPIDHTAKTPAKRQKAPPGGAVVVQKGDSLFRIAQRYRVTVAALMSANGLTSPDIVPGQRLVLPR